MQPDLQRDGAYQTSDFPLSGGGAGINPTLAKWLWTLALLNVANFFWTTNLYYTRQVVLVNLSCLALTWLASEILYYHKRRLVYLCVIIGASVIVCIEGAAQWWLGYGIIIHWAKSGAPIATIGNTNYVGVYLIFIIFAYLSIITYIPRYYKLLFLPSFALALLIMVQARARASWVGAVVGLTVWAYLTLKRKVFVLVVLCAVLTGSFTWSLMPERWRNADTLGYRLKYWAAAIELWKDSPLIGIGFDGYRIQVYEAQARINDRQKTFFNGYVDPKPRRVHNEYLQALVDGGIIYASVYFGFFAWVLIKSFKAGKASPLIRGVWCCQIAVLVTAFFFFSFRLVDTAMLFHINLGILCGISRS